MNRWLKGVGVAGLVCARANGQGLETFISGDVAGVRPLQPEVVKMSADESGPLFGGIEAGAHLQLSRPVNRLVAWRVDVGYGYGHHRFELPCQCVMPYDRVVVIENDLRIHGANVMGGLELRTPREQYWFLSIRAGVEVLAYGERDAEYSIRFLAQRSDSSVALETDERYMPGAGWGIFMPRMEMSLGRQFSQWHPVRMEVFLRQDLAERAYELVNLQGLSQEVPLRRTSIGVRVGVHLGQRSSSRDEAVIERAR